MSPLGALIQVLEVGEELSIVSAEKKWSDADLKCSIGRKKEVSYPRRGRSGGGAPEEPSPAHLLFAICLEKEKETGVFWLEKEEGKVDYSRWRSYSADGIIDSPR